MMREIKKGCTQHTLTYRSDELKVQRILCIEGQGSGRLFGTLTMNSMMTGGKKDEDYKRRITKGGSQKEDYKRRITKGGLQKVE